MTKRITVALPLETIKILDAVAPKGKRGRVISDALVSYAERRSETNLAERLKAGAKANAKRDLEIATEWFALDEEAWQRLETEEK